MSTMIEWLKGKCSLCGNFTNTGIKVHVDTGEKVLCSFCIADVSAQLKQMGLI